MRLRPDATRKYSAEADAGEDEDDAAHGAPPR
jgi:hypothetical protein